MDSHSFIGLLKIETPVALLGYEIGGSSRFNAEEQCVYEGMYVGLWFVIHVKKKTH